MLRGFGSVEKNICRSDESCIFVALVYCVEQVLCFRKGHKLNWPAQNLDLVEK